MSTYIDSGFALHFLRRLAQHPGVSLDLDALPLATR
jgi:hypothetical protein